MLSTSDWQKSSEVKTDKNWPLRRPYYGTFSINLNEVDIKERICSMKDQYFCFQGAKVTMCPGVMCKTITAWPQTFSAFPAAGWPAKAWLWAPQYFKKYNAIRKHYCINIMGPLITTRAVQENKNTTIPLTCKMWEFNVLADCLYSLWHAMRTRGRTLAASNLVSLWPVRTR